MKSIPFGIPRKKVRESEGRKYQKKRGKYQKKRGKYQKRKRGRTSYVVKSQSVKEAVNQRKYFSKAKKKFGKLL